jgi:hypothetical protein
MVLFLSSDEQDTKETLFSWAPSLFKNNCKDSLKRVGFLY